MTPPRLDDVVPARVIAVSHEEVVRCWDVLTGRHLGDIAGAQSAVTATLPDGRIVLAIDYLDGNLTSHRCQLATERRALERLAPLVEENHDLARCHGPRLREGSA